MPRRTPRSPSIGFCSCSRPTASRSVWCRASRSSVVVLERDLDREVGLVGQELVQRRVDEPDRDRQPVHLARISVKSWRCSGSSSASAASRPASSSARISRSTSSRRGPRNMCSVRHSPMPCGAEPRARAASSGVSAFARTSRRRTASAWSEHEGDRLHEAPCLLWCPRRLRGGGRTEGVGDRDGAEEHLAGGAVDGHHVTLGEGGAAADPDPSLLDVDLELARRRRRRCGPCRGPRRPRARSCRRGW